MELQVVKLNGIRCLGLIFIALSGRVFALDKPVDVWTLGQNQRGDSVSIVINEVKLASLSEGESINIPLKNSVLNAKVTHIEQVEGIRIVHAKNTADIRLPSILLFQHPDYFSAWIPTKSGTFRVKNGRIFKEINRTGGKDDFVETTDHSSSVVDVGEQYKSSSSQSVSSTVTSSSTSRKDFKVLFVVTDEFVQNYPDVNATLTEWVVANNSIYSSSGINLNIVNAGFIQADIEFASEQTILDSLSDSTGFALYPFTDQMLNSIWDKRIEEKADFIVVMKYGNRDDLCGLGFLNGNSSKSFQFKKSVSVVIDTYHDFFRPLGSCGYDTLGHELGHNMGLGHSLVQGSVGTVFDFGRGYGVDDQFSTVMAYPSAFGSASPVPLFSSPDLTCLNSFACGVDKQSSDGADAVYAINQVATQVSSIYDENNPYFSIEEALNQVDSSFEQCVRNSISSERLTSEVDFLNCRNVTSIQGIERFSYVDVLDLRSADVSDISALRRLTRLEAIDLYYTNVSDLSPLSGVKDLLRILWLSVDNLSCQQVNVVQNAWAINDFKRIGSCQSLSNDSEDFDNDGINNLNDTDDDNDGIDDITDGAPFDASNANDIDADGVLNENDLFPLDPSESSDFDGDGLGNNSDTDDDNDGMSDEFETLYGLNPLSDADAQLDLDNDGLTNLREFQLGTNPSMLDSDYDGISDGDEVIAGTDPSVHKDAATFIRTDFNGDGYADIIYRNENTLKWSFHLTNNGQVTQTDNIEGMSAVASWQYNGTGDFNGDGYDDVIIRNSTSGQWYIYFFNGSTMISRGYSNIENAKLVGVQAVADFNQDGMADVLLRNEQTGQWTMSLINTRQVASILNPPMSQVLTWEIVDAADFDANGSPDILIRNRVSGGWYIYLYENTNIINRGYLSTLTTDLKDEIQGVADFNGDGSSDVLIRNKDTRKWKIIFMNGRAPISTDDVALPEDAEWQFNVADDFNLDGKADVVLRNGNNVRVYHLNGTSIRSTQDLDVVLTESQQVRVLN
ncbi:FG-GAP repeat protein [Paraneptunicella aestuarii]|uniref:FG-GAP-like repeat-containing protein n=1 Tax=Paraneptunicella aestuarii TaxID=2831148 RepID=UPI001E3BDB47|nr:FG-GAP-like repeat-containing protein [Paraneptunicella aestuarii]UAA37641.1 FG-GAP repeat protein [Paraneptunicella aestuarii]